MRRADPRRGDPLVAASVLRAEHDAVFGDWAELCRWDPSLPPDIEPTGGLDVVDAVIDALDRPQPIGWGPDADVERAVLVFAVEHHSVAVAIGALACLREALARRLRGRLPESEAEETWLRLGVVVDRAIGVAAQALVDRLETDALTDPLTHLGNRRALDRDLHQELARAARHNRMFSLVLLDLDGLKAVNDSEGHEAGDTVLRRLAAGLVTLLRAGDRAYRVGGDEFALVLPETSVSHAASALRRLVDAGAPAMSWGIAAFPANGRSQRALLAVADQRLYEHKSRPRS